MSKSLQPAMMRPVGFFFLLLMLLHSCILQEAPDLTWKAPRDARKKEIPFAVNASTEQGGKQLYNLYCGSCHGPAGFGDGPAGRELSAKPANFHDSLVQQQSNGSLFWKVSTGRGSMPAFNTILSINQRWQIVTYIRKLPALPPQLISPTALNSHLSIEHVMQVAPQAVRILQNPVTNDIWYTTFDGDVFRVKDFTGTHPVSDKMLSVKDHGIEVLQGATFLDNTLFLCGNVYADKRISTRGRMVRCNMADTGRQHVEVVFNTVNYAANKTIYDHGWNALVISPDHKYLFVNSGARTDHGEIQDNGGAYPNARDNALTSKIFRFPIDSRNLELHDNLEELKSSGYLYAEGIRNAYDMAFDGEGNLFCVVNSADYDYPEDMFWIREHHHYGFPWVMGGMENPQQYSDWHPDPETDPFINKTSHSWEVKYYYNDPEFPKRPPGVKFSPGVQNLGPDANEYRGHSGKVQDGDQTGVAVSTFTAHCCPLGLCFDTKKNLGESFTGDGFVLRFTLGAGSSLMKPFTDQGADLLHLHLSYDSSSANYFVTTNRIVEGFQDAVDAILIGHALYVIEYGGKGGNIWKINFPEKMKK